MPTTDDLYIIGSALQKAASYTLRYKNICVMVSGGSDSDDMLAILLKTVPKEKLHFVFCDTGIEMTATRDHLCYLEQKYGITIERIKAKVPVPLGCLRYGQPFLTKYVSEMIERLQRHNFKWENEPFDILYEKYPKCKTALKWWCNENGNKSRYNINKHAYLKEFIIRNPPTFRISQKCCKGAKKDVGEDWIIKHNPDMRCMGIRKFENGIRSQKYKNCFTYKAGLDCQEYRPIFYFTEKTKVIFDKEENITHSKCYTEYGLHRTGCAGCPFGSSFEKELESLAEYEPKLFLAVKNIFADSYDYTRKYRKFKEAQK